MVDMINNPYSFSSANTDCCKSFISKWCLWVSNDAVSNEYAQEHPA